MNFIKRFENIIALSRDLRRTLSPAERGLKVGEEVGEFMEALLHKLGKLRHKVMKEKIEGEVADIWITSLDALAAVYPEKSPQEIMEMMNEQLKAKTAKWASIQQAPEPEETSLVEVVEIQNLNGTFVTKPRPRVAWPDIDPNVVKPDEPRWPFPKGNSADRIKE